MLSVDMYFREDPEENYNRMMDKAEEEKGQTLRQYITSEQKSEIIDLIKTGRLENLIIITPKDGREAKVIVYASEGAESLSFDYPKNPDATREEDEMEEYFANSDNDMPSIDELKEIVKNDKFIEGDCEYNCLMFLNETKCVWFLMDKMWRSGFSNKRAIKNSINEAEGEGKKIAFEMMTAMFYMFLAIGRTKPKDERIHFYTVKNTLNECWDGINGWRA
jgi:hypothetical protein